MTRPARSRIARALTGIVTLGVFALSGAAVVSGAALISENRKPGAAQPQPATPVRVMPVRFEQGYLVTRRFVGQIEASNEADLGFEVAGRVTRVLVDEGDVVAAGTVLARLDTSALIPERATLEAELAALSADAELARLTLARNKALTARGFRSVAAQDEARLALARAEAGMAAFRAQIAGVDVRLEKSVLVAPFAGRTGARLADPGQTVAAGQPILKLFDRAPAHARVGVPGELALDLRPGDRARIEAGGIAREATILHIRPDLDPATRSLPVIVALSPGDATALGGTVDLILQQHIPEQGFWAPLSALHEGARGSWSVLAVETADGGDLVRAVAVEVIHGEGARVFLSGMLPAGARIVAEAPDRVAPGQRVAPLPVSPQER